MDLEKADSLKIVICASDTGNYQLLHGKAVLMPKKYE